MQKVLYIPILCTISAVGGWGWGGGVSLFALPSTHCAFFLLLKKMNTMWICISIQIKIHDMYNLPSGQTIFLASLLNPSIEDTVNAFFLEVVED